MNKENILKLASFIETSNDTFDMLDSWVYPSCRSAGCIGAHAALLWPDIRSEGHPEDDSFTWRPSLFREKLGLSPEVADRLCFPGDTAPSKGTRQVAVATLRNLAETGEVKFVLPFEGTTP